MRIVEKVLYGLGGLLALMLFFVALCRFNPGLAQKIGGTIQVDAHEKSEKDIGINTVVNNDSNGAIKNNNTVSETVNMAYAAEGSQIQPQTITNNDIDVRASVSDEDEVQLNVPSKVAGLSGYIPIKETGMEIDQAKADEIASNLSKGKTGSNMVLDEQMYIYYVMLNDKQKAIYKQICANAEAQIDNFAPIEKITTNDLKMSFTAVVNDHPELFWVETSYKYKYTPNGQVADITLIFNITAKNIDVSKSDFEKGAKQIIAATYGYYTDYEKERIAHDALISKVKYDANAPMNQSAYSALVYDRTVSAGYARAFQYVLQQMGIPCYYVTGYTGQNHAWNMVRLSDGYYNVDVTWDDTNPSTYDYFNCSDADYAKNHIRKDLSIYLPACNGNRYSGLEVNPSVTPPTPTVPPTTPSTPNTNTNISTNTNTNTNTSNNNTNGNTNNSNNNTATNNKNSISVVTVRGVTEDNVYYIDNIKDYYSECFASMINSDKSVINFDLIVIDKKLWDSIYKSYERGECQEGYIDRYLVEKHKNSCRVNVEAVQRSDGSYLIKHNAIIN